jgi:putative ATP-binding cassette transporter
MAGIWPFGRGEIKLGERRILFVPQRPYLPLGTLASALLYPLGTRSRVDADRHGDKRRFSTARLVNVLQQVGLEALTSELDRVEHWSQRLSLGEQKRLGFAKLLLAEAKLLFLDEATSALDEPSEARLYGLLRAAPWRPTVVSVSHRSTLLHFHDNILDVAAFRIRAGQVPARLTRDCPSGILTTARPTCVACPSGDVCSVASACIG